MGKTANSERRRRALVIALDLGGTKLASALVTSEGRVWKAWSAPTDVSSGRACLDQLLAAARRAWRMAGDRAAAIGVSIPGLVRRDGTVWAPNIPGWVRAPVGRRLREATGLPAAVESDRNASVLGEVWRGAARGAADAIYLIVGTGIGAGILSGGRLLRGAHELCGCAGWMVFDAEGRCRSLEQLAAGPAVGAAGALALKKPNLTARQVLAAARRGDRAARDVVQRAASLLGLAVANLISLFDPEVIVLGGGLGSSGKALLAPLRRTALKWAQPLSARQVRITASRLGARAPLLGVARLAWEELRISDCGLRNGDGKRGIRNPKSAIRPNGSHIDEW